MFPAFVLTFREVLEAALIMGILLGVLEKTNRRDLRGWVWGSALLAALACVVVGFLLRSLGAAFEGRAEEIFEGVVMLIAAGFLTWMLFVLHAQSQRERKNFSESAQRAADLDNRSALFAITFLAVLREGIELSLFLTAAAIKSDGLQVIAGSALGFVSVAVIAVLFFKGLVRLNISKFFQVATILLVIFAAGLVAHGVHELNEAGVIPSIIEHVWDVNHILDENSFIGQILKVLTGYNANPSLSEILAYLLYLAVVTLFSTRLIGHTKQLP